jgi:hypothetical protein
MKAKSYLDNLKQREASNDWYTVKPGNGAFVAMTTPSDEQRFNGEVHDMSVMDPSEILERFEEYEDSEFDGEEWVI